MATINQPITARVQNIGIVPTVFAVQSDTGREITCNVMDWEIPDGATAKTLVRLPSGTVVEGDCTIDGNAVTATLTAEMLAEKGKAAFCVEITSGGETVTTFQINLFVGQKNC